MAVDGYGVRLARAVQAGRLQQPHRAFLAASPPPLQLVDSHGAVGAPGYEVRVGEDGEDAPVGHGRAPLAVRRGGYEVRLRFGRAFGRLARLDRQLDDAVVHVDVDRRVLRLGGYGVRRLGGYGLTP